MPGASADRHVSSFMATYSLDAHPSFIRKALLTLLTCPEQVGRERDPYETELSAILLTFIECEAKQE